MCGICGIIPRNSKISKQSIAGVKAMNDALAHRGPNSEGYYNDENVAIGMRRLSIIDLGTGSQPLYNEDKSIILIANGEIYNYIELREELKDKGHIFSTGSDCETIIHSYEEYGDTFIDHLRGMFAFCLYDTRSGRVILARDRMGEKPIYIYRTDTALAFSSELKSLIQIIPKDARAINKDSLYLYFHYGYIPGSRTMLKSITKLLPAHMISIDLKSGSISDSAYWDKSKIPLGMITPTKPKEIIQKELNDIERIIIRSDVPVGVSLSGGIDSSLIASLAKKYSKNPLHAFSVGYPGYPENDERRAALKLANELGLVFHDIEISEKTFTQDFPALIASMDDPISDIAAYGYYAVSREARKQNVPVLLAGFGGDELFWGYRWVREAAQLSDLKRSAFGRTQVMLSLTKKFWRNILKNPAAMLPNIIRMAFSDKAILYELTPQWMYVAQNEKNIFSREFLSVIDRSAPLKAEEKQLQNNNGLSVTELISDLWLVSNCIDLGDRMSMANSIELRLPLVDYHLYEQVARIRANDPKDYQLGYKHALIETAKSTLPKYVLESKKRGFTPPTGAWIEHALSAHKGLLMDGYLVTSGVVNKSFMTQAIEAPQKNTKFLYSALVLEMWAKTYIA